MKAVMSNLRDQIGMTGPRPVMHCPWCHTDWSASRGDYWQYSDDHVFHCMVCDTELQILVKVERYEEPQQ
jgi:hypothetical protein